MQPFSRSAFDRALRQFITRRQREILTEMRRASPEMRSRAGPDRANID